MTHKELVKIAEQYLYKVKRCAFVFTELVTSCNETPDAIGFYGTYSWLIEVKVSRSDFFAEIKKKVRHRAPEYTAGNFRYFMCPTDMIKVNELPEKWGLIYVDKKGKYTTVKNIDRRLNYQELQEDNNSPLYPNKFECRKIEEYKMMYSALRRLKLRGVLPLIYEDAKTKVKIIKENEQN